MMRLYIFVFTYRRNGRKPRARAPSPACRGSRRQGGACRKSCVPTALSGRRKAALACLCPGHERGVLLALLRQLLCISRQPPHERLAVGYGSNALPQLRVHCVELYGRHTVCFSYCLIEKTPPSLCRGVDGDNRVIPAPGRRSVCAAGSPPCRGRRRARTCRDPALCPRVLCAMRSRA